MVGKTARFVPPIALAAIVFGVYLIVHSTYLKHTPPTPTHSGAVVVNGRRQVAHTGRHRPKYYTVKPGDTLSSIADKTGVSMAKITSLNPSLATSPNNLQTGQRLKL